MDGTNGADAHAAKVRPSFAAFVRGWFEWGGRVIVPLRQAEDATREMARRSIGRYEVVDRKTGATVRSKYDARTLV